MYEDVLGPNYHLGITQNGQEETGHENYAVYRSSVGMMPGSPLRLWYATPEEAVKDYQEHRDFLNRNVWYFDGIMDDGELDGFWYVRFPQEVQTLEAATALLQAVFDEYNQTADGEKAWRWDDISLIPDELWEKHGMAAVTDQEQWPDGQPAVALHFETVPELGSLRSALCDEDALEA